jgi:transposase
MNNSENAERLIDSLPDSDKAKLQVTESVGVLVKFLPPYSSDLSPIELCWSKVTQFLRSREGRPLE